MCAIWSLKNFLTPLISIQTSLDVQKYSIEIVFLLTFTCSYFRFVKIDFDELEQKLTKLENDCRAAFEYLRVISKHETPQVKTKYVLKQ